MYFKNNYVALVYRVALIVLCAVAVVGTTGLPLGNRFESFGISLQYYGVLSAILVLGYYLVSTLPTLSAYLARGVCGKARVASHFKGALVMMMVFELVVYSLFLADTPFVFSQSTSVFIGPLLHYIVPLMVVTDYALFDRKGGFRFSDPIYWMTAPLLYFSFVVLGSMFGVTYFGGVSFPYSFINPDLSDWGQVLQNVFYFILTFLALGYLLYFVDRLLCAMLRREVSRAQTVALNAYSAPTLLPRVLLDAESEIPIRSEDASVAVSGPTFSHADEKGAAETLEENDCGVPAGEFPSEPINPEDAVNANCLEDGVQQSQTVQEEKPVEESAAPEQPEKQNPAGAAVEQEETMGMANPTEDPSGFGGDVKADRQESA